MSEKPKRKAREGTNYPKLRGLDRVEAKLLGMSDTVDAPAVSGEAAIPIPFEMRFREQI